MEAKSIFALWCYLQDVRGKYCILGLDKGWKGGSVGHEKCIAPLRPLPSGVLCGRPPAVCIAPLAAVANAARRT